MTRYLLVHGGWSDGSVWRDVAAELQRNGHDAQIVDLLPSVRDTPGTLADLAADAAHLRSILDAAEEDVVLVGHSYAGMVLTEVADHPRIGHSVYLTAFWPKRGETLLDIRSANSQEWIVPLEDTLRITDDAAMAHEVLGADVAPDRFAEFYLNRRPQSAASFVSPSTAPARGHRTTFIVCDQDQCILVADQERMSAAADTVVRIDAGHMAPLSRPETVAAELLAIA